MADINSIGKGTYKPFLITEQIKLPHPNLGKRIVEHLLATSYEEARLNRKKHDHKTN